MCVNTLPSLTRLLQMSDPWVRPNCTVQEWRCCLRLRSSSRPSLCYRTLTGTTGTTAETVATAAASAAEASATHTCGGPRPWTYSSTTRTSPMASTAIRTLKSSLFLNLFFPCCLVTVTPMPTWRSGALRPWRSSSAPKVAPLLPKNWRLTWTLATLHLRVTI